MTIEAYMSITEAKAQLLRLVREIEDSDEVLAITRDGAPAAVLLGTEHYAALMETLEVLADGRAMASIKRSRRQAARGQFVEAAEVLAGDRAKPPR
jgi:antitoxin YefM